MLLDQLETAGIFYKKAVNMLKMVQKCIQTTISDTKLLCQHIPDLLDWVLSSLHTMKDSSLATFLLETVLRAVREGQCHPTARTEQLLTTVLTKTTARLTKQMASLSNPGEVVRFVNTLSDLMRETASSMLWSADLKALLDTVVANSLEVVVATAHHPVAESMVDKWRSHAYDTNTAVEAQAHYRQVVVDAMLSSAVTVVQELHAAFSLLDSDQPGTPPDLESLYPLWLESLTTVSVSAVLKLVERWDVILNPLHAETLETMLCGCLLKRGSLTEAAEYAQGHYYLECLVEQCGSSVEVLLQADAMRELTLADEALCLPETVKVVMVATIEGQQAPLYVNRNL
jgi:hypothetical protein